MIAEQEQELLTLFGKKKWRKGQRELVEWAMQGQACLGVLPTGHGKSLSFQVAALMMGGCSVVISPLIALMQDQVAVLQGLGIAAARFDSSLGLEEREQVLHRLRAGEVRLLYLAPESMDKAELLSILQEIELGLFVVDEAHCVSAWGHSFRPDYLKLPAWAARLPFKSLMALTATATPRVRTDLQQAFGIDEQHCVVLPPYRDNIERHIQISSDKLADLKQFLAQPQHRPAIIYARSRKNVEELAAQLSTPEQPVPCYHAGQHAETRAATQQQFLNNDIQVLVATIAFGMGIDKPDVRSVIHYHAPNSPEAYVQESGRAGRDGQPSRSLLLLDAQDDIAIRNRIWAEEPDAEGIARCVRWLVPPT
ncbi:MAG: RecQ family ATP-dependent DNA helicase, partial [Akkermansia sp.]